MPVFSGVHGTSLANAEKINENGFIIPSFYEGQSKFGPGIYFYENNEVGRVSALNWAAFRFEDEPGVCVLAVRFSYDPEKCVIWNGECETLLASQIARYCLDEGCQKAPTEIENNMRVGIIDYLLKGLKPQVVFAKYPIPGNSSCFQNGCCVRDASILPEPPYDVLDTKFNCIGDSE